MSARSDVEIIEATPGHRALLMADMRAVDFDELTKVSGQDPRMAIRNLMRSSSIVRSAFIGGEFVAMVGIKPLSLIDGIGMPWLCTTNAIDRHTVTFLRHCRRVIADASAGYRLLRTWVDPERSRAADWIEWVGLECMGEDPVPGVDGLFRRYEKRVLE